MIQFHFQLNYLTKYVEAQDRIKLVYHNHLLPKRQFFLQIVKSPNIVYNWVSTENKNKEEKIKEEKTVYK